MKHDDQTGPVMAAAPKPAAPRNKENDYLPPTPEEGRFDPVKGERALWQAVITQALMDARCESQKSEAIEHKRQALLWLKGLSPDFFFVCCNANLEASYVRRKCREAIARGCKWRAEATSKQLAN